MTKIFVSIAAFRDPELYRTILDAGRCARWPGNLVFGVCEQNVAQASLQARRFPFGGHIRYLRVDPEQSWGVCWARSIVQSLYRGEDFYLQIDSHTAFDPGWDERLLEAWSTLRREAPDRGPILTAYLQTYWINGDGQREMAHNGGTYCMTVKDGFGKAGTVADVFLEVHSSSRDEAWLPALHTSGHFLFAPGRFVQDVPYDPGLYYQGEEQAVAIRAFTAGYDLFHIHAPPLYHKYARERPCHWDEPPTLDPQRTWWGLDHDAKARLTAMLVQGQDFGVYGLGTRRTRADFARYCGIDYEAFTVEDRALTGVGFWPDRRAAPEASAPATATPEAPGRDAPAAAAAT